MANTQEYGKEARAKLLAGVEKLNKAVSVTLGPAGRTVLFRHQNAVISTKDGVTVAREINLADVFESIGADLIKGAAGQTVDEAGDGTTTATLLAHAIFAAGCDAINAGVEPTKLVKGIEKAVSAIIGDYDAKSRKYNGGILEQFSVPCDERLAFEAAKISANGDEKIAKVVSEAVLKCGIDGALTIGNSHSKDHVLEVVDGMQVDAGMVHPYFVNDPQKNRCVLENVTVLMLNRRLSTADEAGSVLEQGIKAATKEGRAVNLLIFCDDIDPEALNVILKNRLKQDMPIPSVIVRTPLWADARQGILEDLAVITGGKRIESPKGKHMESLVASDFGFAEKVVVTGTKTIITAEPMSAFYAEKTFDPHVAQIKAMTQDESLRADQIDAAKKRLAALTGGVAVIKVGGTSMNDVTETKFRVEDAIHATRAAVADGVVPGGGSALLFAREAYRIQFLAPFDPTETNAEAVGVDLLLGVLSRPMEQIAANAGYKGELIIGEVLADNGFSGTHVAASMRRPGRTWPT